MARWRACFRCLRPLALVLLSYVAAGGVVGSWGRGSGNGEKPGGGSTLRGGAGPDCGVTLGVGSMGATLRGGVGSGVGTSVGGTGAGDGAGLGAGVAMLVSRAVISLSACTWLSVRGASGELADGLFKAVTMSWMPASTRSVEDASGIVTFVGNHETVSQMRAQRVSQSQMVKQRYESRAGPMNQPSISCGDHVSRAAGFSWARTRMPGGATGVQLKSKVP
jgi:hypothetical protein